MPRLKEVYWFNQVPMKLLSFQPFSLYSHSGGARILRRLYAGNEHKVVSLSITTFMSLQTINTARQNESPGKSPEYFVPAYPLSKSWQRWYLRKLVIWLRIKAFRQSTIKNIQKKAASLKFDAVHTIDHYAFSAALCKTCAERQLPLWVSFHDHFLTTNSSFESTKQLWQQSARRLCISNEIGLEYQRLFGHRDFEIITDGVKPNEISTAIIQPSETISIYFAGMLHLDYIPLFKVLADALDVLTNQGMKFKFILRGAHKIDALNNRKFEVAYRPIIINDKELKEELDAASILYLPMYFNNPSFYLYSLSTKMVGYLGAPGSILYHGPNDSAAGILLQKNEAAICCNSLQVDEVIANVRHSIQLGKTISKNAKQLAQSRFNLDIIQKTFWQ